MNVPWSIRDYPVTSPPDAFGPYGDFVRLWQSKNEAAHQDGRFLPAWKDFDLTELRPWWGRISMLEREDATGRFRIALWGTKVAEWYGADVTNQYLEEIFDHVPDRREIGMNHLAFFLHGEVVAFWREVPTHFNRDYAAIEGLSVPLSRNGESTTHMINLITRVSQEDAFWPAIPSVAEF